MIPDFDAEFLKAYYEIRKYVISEDGLIEVANYYPDRYGKYTGKEVSFNPALSQRAGEDYLKIIRGYLRFYKIPMTMESITAAYDWGFGNLRKNGLYKAPRRTKALIGKMRTTLQPQAESLDSQVK